MKFGTFFSKKPAPKEYYLGLFLKETEVLGFVFEIIQGKVSIVAKDTIQYTNGWDSVLEDTDELLMRLETTAGAQCEKVIFFVYSYFIEENVREIKKQYREVIKNILKHLDLKPLGYIECYEAVAEHIQKRDKTPLNAVLLELDKSFLGVFVFKGGKKIFSRSITRTGDIITDLSGIFGQMGEILLPSRLIMYDSIDVSRESHTILTHQWDASLFVQHPRTEIVSEEDLHAGLAAIFGSQLGMEEQGSMVEAAPPVAEAPQEVLGFAIGADVAAHAAPAHAAHADHAHVAHEKPVHPSEPPMPKKKFSLPTFAMPALPLGKLQKMPLKFAWIPVVVLLLVGGFIIEYFFHTAEYEVFMPSQSLSKSVTLTVPVNREGEKMQIITSTSSAEMTESKAASGKREVGEKAKGEVQFSNFDNKERVVAKGTTLSADSIQFILDSEVKVASASTVNNTTRVAGNAKGSVTASEIGPDGNIAKGKKLSVSDVGSDVMFAVADSAFSGGTKKEIKIVAKKDYDDLQKAVIDKAKAAMKTGSASLSGDEKLLTSLTEVTARDLRYDKEINEEASQLTLKANVDTTYFIYHDAALKETIIAEFADETPDGYSIDPNKVTYSGKDVKNDDGEVTMDIEAQAMAIKRASPSEILKKIVGKNDNSVENILRSDFKAAGYEAKIHSPLFFFGSTAPFFAKNIKVKVTSR